MFRIAGKRLGDLSGRSLLDFGCGTGTLCRIAAEFGLQPVGIEPDPRAREEIRRNHSFTVFESLVELQKVQAGKRFDLITMWDVIEHLRQPWNDLYDLSSFLNPGAWLIVSTPNARSLRALVEGPKWADYINPTHFFFFDNQSLKATLSKAGFSQISEWRRFVHYPHHGAFRKILQMFLTACALQGELLFVAQKNQYESLGFTAKD